MAVEEVTHWPPARPVVTAIAAAALAADGVDPIDEAAHLVIKNHGLEHARLWLVGEAGFALVHDDVLELVVHPEARRSGVGTALAAAASPYAGHAWSHGDHPAAARMAHHLGWERARELWVMRRSLTSWASQPATATIRAFQSGDEPAILAINAAAFAGHPEQGDMDAANLAERMAEPWFDPEGLLVAELDGRPAGFHWTKQHNADLGEVYVLAIDPGAHGGGIGKQLVAAGLSHLAQRGMTEVHLYVEGTNPKAKRLYAAMGFEHTQSHVQYVRR